MSRTLTQLKQASQTNKVVHYFQACRTYLICDGENHEVIKNDVLLRTWPCCCRQVPEVASLDLGEGPRSDYGQGAGNWTGD